MVTTILSLLVLASIAGLEAAKPETSRENLRSLLTDHFTTPRHHVTNPDGLVAAENFIFDTFKGYNMQVAKQYFSLQNNGETYIGVNVIGLWPGRQFMSGRDKPIVLVADYESPYEMSGVEDNGSGLAALLETARLITSQPCLQDYTVGFVATDFSANNERDLQITPCDTLACGARAFVTDILVPFMNSSDIGTKDIQFIVLDSLLNFNNTPGAQVIPNEDAFKTVPGLVDSANAIQADSYRGNFLAVVSRDYDSSLAAAFNSKFDEAGSPQFKRRDLTLPFTSITDELKQDPLWQLYSGLTDVDIKAFYEVIPEVKALFLTDTVIFRGREKEWDSLTVDDSMTITDERLDFLKKTTDALTRMVEDLTGHKETCNKDPMSEFPAEPGFQMTGTLGENFQAKDNVTLTVHTVKPHGVVNVTLASPGSWSLNMIGTYDPLEDMQHLYLPEPFNVEGAPGTISCRVLGRFHRHDSRLVMFVGRMRGYCTEKLSFFGGRPGGFDRAGFLTLSSIKEVASSSGPSLALPVVLSLLGGMAFSAALAAVAWFVYTKRLADASANSLPMKENQ
ncbi:Hypp3487 [Branchiostoma lanceolatum]|uniref:Hypp3487 protein n=1 Tax=Branchiostoma lanceolatum TaxID=7740 RepID=A0A8J9ZZF1_BRALA|nr:Hypp3487 [Branchiostoma lanceolatum]